VVDTTRPPITCPAGIRAECTGGGRADVDVGTPIASDVCGDVTLRRAETWAI
jgi:hypothetical protein